MIDSIVFLILREPSSYMHTLYVIVTWKHDQCPKGLDFLLYFYCEMTCGQYSFCSYRELCNAATGAGGLGFPWIHIGCGVIGSYHGERWRQQLNKCFLKEKNKFVPK